MRRVDVSRGRRLTFWVLSTVLALGLGSILGCGWSSSKTALFKSTTYGISFSYPGSWNLEAAPKSSSPGLKPLAVVDGGTVGDVAVGMLDASGERDPRSHLLFAVRYDIKDSEGDGDQVSDPTFEYLDGHPAYGWTTTYPDKVTYNIAIAGKPYCFVLLGDMWPGHQSDYRAAFTALVASIRFSGPSVAWSVDPNRWETYVDREASCSLRYPESYVAEDDASRRQGAVTFMHVDSSAAIGPDPLAAGMVRVVPVGLPRESSKSEAERFLTRLIRPADLRHRFVSEMRPKGARDITVTPARSVSIGKMPAATFTVTDKDAAGTSYRFEAYLVVTHKTLLGIWLASTAAAWSANRVSLESIARSLKSL